MAVLSILAAGVGLTLTASSIVVFAELYWNPGHLYQAEARCHRIGQESHVSVYYLIAKDTIDEMIWDMVNRKVRVLGGALDRDANDKMVAQHSVAELDLSSQAIKVHFSPLVTHGFRNFVNIAPQSKEFVSLVLEKVHNYDKRKERMERRQQIRKGGLEVGDDGEMPLMGGEDDILIDDVDDQSDVLKHALQVVSPDLDDFVDDRPQQRVESYERTMIWS